MTEQTFQLPSSDELMAIARRETGIDMVDQEAVEPLRVLVNAINAESQLHEAGFIEMRSKLLRILSNRLRMKRDIAAHPEILDEKIEAPIFIFGLPRTGSTKTQKILSMSGDFNWLTLWMAHSPALLTGDRSESVQPRIDGGYSFEHFMETNSPDHKRGHHFLALEPEEDSMLLEHSLVTPIFTAWSKIHAYAEWLAGQDMRLQFYYLRDALKYLQWQGLAKSTNRWVLKCPLYIGFEAELLSAFPDANILMTHRDPKTTLASALKVLESFFRAYSNQGIGEDIGYQVYGQAQVMKAHLANRASIAGLKIHDIDYREMTSSAETALQKIYDFCGLELKPQSRKRMMDWDNGNPIHKQGKHEYALATYGQTPEGIDALFSDYLGFMNNAFARA